ncbi:MAG: patatin-like phospholipase family protein [Opitutales bacterium]|nr:patatin-like phospholipase family protein [Opitutales bacterium]
MNKTRILSIDGGGIRGIIPGQVLVKLEQKLQQRAGDDSVRIADCFDLVAGTSTGGILACILLCPGKDGRPRFTAKQAVALYTSYGANIFDADWKWKARTANGVLGAKYPEAALETYLKQYLGDLELKDMLKPCLIPAYNTEQRNVHFFRSYRAAKTPSYNFPMWQVARSTSAAPTYFRPHKAVAMDGKAYSLIDGGIVANNPSMCAFTEGHTHFQATATDMVILSLGTGTALKSYPYTKIKNWGMLHWAVPTIDILMSGGPDVDEFQLDQIFKASKVPHQYLRINVDLNSIAQNNQIEVSPDMDNADISNLEELSQAGRWLADSYSDQLDAIVDQLLDLELPEVKRIKLDPGAAL